MSASVPVSFVVPCYRLAHLLGECVSSILAQSFEDFEIVIMDDCSPDDTAGVARGFRDPRVRYIRNDVNLGHLRNYNRGLELARGAYVWLISADDVLCGPHALQRFVDVLDANPHVGYVFSPAVRFDGRMGHGLNGDHGRSDRIFAPGAFLSELLKANCVPTPSVLARASCYQQAGLFPLDLPFAGDWYVWSAFALHHGVAYVAEPMANYRYHPLNMTKACMKDPVAIVAEGLAVRWRIRRLIQRSGHTRLLHESTQCMAYYYAALLANRALQGDPLGLELGEFERSLTTYCADSDERAHLRALVYSAVGDEYYDAGDHRRARERYEWALKENWQLARTWAKYVLLRSGGLGRRVRDAATQVRDRQAPVVV